MLRAIAVAISACLSILSVAAAPAASSMARTPVHGQPARNANGAAAISALIQSINSHRAALHLKPYLLSAKQNACSKAHSKGMAKANALSDTVAPAFPKDICIKYTAAGENIGNFIKPPKPGVIGIDNAFWAEGPCPAPCPSGSAKYNQHYHYLNLASTVYKCVGLGIYYVKKTTWLTEDFVNKKCKK